MGERRVCHVARQRPYAVGVTMNAKIQVKIYTKYTNIQNIHNAINISIKRWSFCFFCFETINNMFFWNVWTFWIFGNIFLYFWCALYYKLLFECVYRIRSHFPYTWTYFKVFFTFFENCPEVWTISVRTVFFVIFCDSLPPPVPISGVNVKVPFRGKNMEHNYCLMIFVWCLCFFVSKMVLKWLRRVAFVG